MSEKYKGWFKKASRVVLATTTTAAMALFAAASAQAGVPDPGAEVISYTPITTSVATIPGAPNMGAWVLQQGEFSHAREGSVLLTYGSATSLGDPDLDTVGGYIAATPDGQGYFTITPDGKMAEFGTARGAYPNISSGSGWRPNIQGGDGYTFFENPISSITSDATGMGGWALDTTGQVWPFGDAHYHGQPSHNEYGNAVDIVATSTGNGYTIVTDTGDVYDYGDAQYHGHPDLHNDEQCLAFSGDHCATGIALTPDDGGYWIVDNYGTVYPYGNAQNLGNNSHATDDYSSYTTDIAANGQGTGYVLVQANGTLTSFTTTSAGNHENAPASGHVLPLIDPGVKKNRTATSTSTSTVISGAKDHPAADTIVARGDTLSQLALDHHVTGGAAALYEANKAVLPDPDSLVAGQQLRIDGATGPQKSVNSITVAIKGKTIARRSINSFDGLVLRVGNEATNVTLTSYDDATGSGRLINESHQDLTVTVSRASGNTTKQLAAGQTLTLP